MMPQANSPTKSTPNNSHLSFLQTTPPRYDFYQPLAKATQALLLWRYARIVKRRVVVDGAEQVCHLV